MINKGNLERADTFIFNFVSLLFGTSKNEVVSRFAQNYIINSINYFNSDEIFDELIITFKPKIERMIKDLEDSREVHSKEIIRYARSFMDTNLFVMSKTCIFYDLILIFFGYFRTRINCIVENKLQETENEIVSYLQYLMVFGCLQNFTKSVNLILDNFDSFKKEKIKKFLDGFMFFKSLKIYAKRIRKSELKIFEWVFFCSFKNIQNVLKNSEYKKFMSRRKILTDNFKSFEDSYATISRDMKNIFLCINDPHIIKICLINTEDKKEKDNMVKLKEEIESGLKNESIFDFEHTLPFYSKNIEKYKNLMLLSSKIYKKSLFFTCLLFEQTSFINYFFVEDEFEEGRAYAAVFEKAVYYRQIQNMVFMKRSRPPDLRSRKNIPKILKSTDKYFKQLIGSALDRRQIIEYNKVRYFFEDSNQEDEITKLSFLLDQDLRFRQLFVSVFEKYEYYKKIENLITYMRFINDIFYVEDDFEDSPLYNCLKDVQKNGTEGGRSRRSRRGSQASEYRRVLRELASERKIFSFIEELSIKYEGKKGFYY